MAVHTGAVLVEDRFRHEALEWQMILSGSGVPEQVSGSGLLIDSSGWSVRENYSLDGSECRTATA